VNSIAQTAANQLARTDIRVNTVCPGLIETGMTVGTFDYARQRGNAGKIGQLNPLGRYGVAEGQYSPVDSLISARILMDNTEVAAAALFLASGTCILLQRRRYTN
jgi:NAD(P)-dependent dehydrogenase (short-subunit alcohol dehydrogenase family)